MSFALKSTTQTPFIKPIIGFDIETYDDNKEFLLSSVHNGSTSKVFHTREEQIDYFKSFDCRESFITATNLGFDFFGTFYGSKDLQNFRTLFRGSNLLCAKTWVKNAEFNPKPVKGSHAVTFIDTMNYAQLSVEKLGKILKMPKFKDSVKEFIGQRPRTPEEWDIMTRYNIRDSEISQKATKYLFDAFTSLGATPKMTIASTAMSCFKNKYLNESIYYVHPEDVLKSQFHGYYGGNTHAYARGAIKDYYYYDFNSLYPTVMLKDLPNPNMLRIRNRNDIGYIESYEGMSYVSVTCPCMDYPFLSYRYDNKLIAPVGNFSGWYTHAELRYAMELGYIITNVRRTFWYKENCSPFRDYVKDLYAKRMEYKEAGNPMQMVVKILLNGLYGKFGQKFENRENVLPFNHTVEELAKFDFVERIGDFIRVKQTVKPSSFCIPIWASYITSYAREKLHRAMIRSNPVYVDTDSLITTKKFTENSQLGGLKLEMKIKEGIIVKPKMYCISDEKTSFVKIKGMGVRLNKREFSTFLQNPTKAYMKFTKFKEAIRRGLIPNEIIHMEKTYNLEDNKRTWAKPFDMNELQFSKPLCLENGTLVEKYKYEHALLPKVVTQNE